MKHMKARIAAMLFAAATTVCASQALSASAFSHTYSSQDYCEEPYNMSYSCRNWGLYGGYYNGQIWDGEVYSGVVCGHGYSQTTFSKTYQGSKLEKSAGFCRMLAESFFGTTTFMEHIVYYNTPLTIGDQVKIDYGNEHRTLFITSITGNTVRAYSLNENTGEIITGEAFTRNGWHLRSQSSNKNYGMDYLTRPIKEYDANGDGIISRDDADWILTNYNNGRVTQHDCGFDNKRWDILIHALQNEHTWKIEYSDYYTIGYNLGHLNGTNQPNNTGRMTYDGSNSYYYVTM